MAYAVVTVLSSAARTSSGSGSAILNADSGDQLALLMNVTAASGTTPTLTVSVEWSMDGTTFAPAETADAFTQVTGTGAKVKTFQVKAPHYRVAYAIGGTTPSFTFSVIGYETT